MLARVLNLAIVRTLQIPNEASTPALSAGVETGLAALARLLPQCAAHYGPPEVEPEPAQRGKPLIQPAAGVGVE